MKSLKVKYLTYISNSNEEFLNVSTVEYVFLIKLLIVGLFLVFNIGAYACLYRDDLNTDTFPDRCHRGHY